MNAERTEPNLSPQDGVAAESLLGIRDLSDEELDTVAGSAGAVGPGLAPNISFN